MDRASNSPGVQMACISPSFPRELRLMGWNFGMTRHTPFRRGGMMQGHVPREGGCEFQCSNVSHYKYE